VDKVLAMVITPVIDSSVRGSFTYGCFQSQQTLRSSTHLSVEVSLIDASGAETLCNLHFMKQTEANVPSIDALLAAACCRLMLLECSL